MKRFIAWAGCLLSLIATPALAAVPQTLSYQGILTDGGGNLVPDGNYSITFRLCDDPTLGGPHLLWTEVHDGAGPNPPAVPVSKGGFSVILGTAVTLPVFNSPLWLEIEVAPNPPVAPRIALTAAPYALNARNIYDGGSNNFVGVGRATRVTTAEYFGVLAPVSLGYGGMYIQTQGVSSLPFYGYRTGSTSAWTYLSGGAPNTPWVVYNAGDRLAVTNTGNVGIGVLDPTARLEVNGGTKLGSDAPAIKVKKLTGTTSAAQNGTVFIATGLDPAQLLAVNVMVEYAPGGLVPPSYTVNGGYEYSWYVATGSVVVWNKAANSAAILSKPVRILITYEE